LEKSSSFWLKISARFTEELGPKLQYIRFPFVPNFHCRSFKNLFFFAFKTCCKILLCNSIAIIHYFWKTKVLNLKNLWVSDRFSCMIHRWKAWISHSIFVFVARQPYKHVLKYHARKLRRHLRVHAGALPVSPLPISGRIRAHCQLMS
jgi:hypothetical protein